ncbi:unnamed protein product [Closterium sp. Yama58-4]|nr:unnamed protein product [Closterium sp. Yama58-4]
MVHNTAGRLRAGYIEYGVNYAEDSDLLSRFLEEHDPTSKREVTVSGTDGEGYPVTHKFELHEEAIKGQKSKGDMESCISVTSLFAQEVVKHLLKRMESLDSLVGAKLFLPDAYPDGPAKRERVCQEWFQSLCELFKADKFALPGTLLLTSFDVDSASHALTPPPPPPPTAICMCPHVIMQVSAGKGRHENSCHSRG